MDTDNDQILILGGGFAGLFAALELCDLQCPLPIRLIDSSQDFVFKPFLYELLCDDIETEQIQPTFADLFAKRQATFWQDTVESIDLPARQIHLSSGKNHAFRYLVLALGDVDSRSNSPGAADHAFSFRSAQDVMVLRQHIQATLQKALSTDNDEIRQACLNFVVVGAGRSGIELAATLADFLPEQYQAMGGEPQEIRVVLLHRDAAILPTVKSDMRDAALQALGDRQCPVDIRLETQANAVTADTVEYSQHQQTHILPTATTLWITGSVTHPLIRSLAVAPVHKDDRERPYLTSALQLIGYPHVFAGGDCAINVHTPRSATAQIAHQQGRAIAKNIISMIQGQPSKPCSTTENGILLKTGLDASVVEIFDTVMLTGRVGHLVRRAAYLSLLPTPESNLKRNTQWITGEVLSQFGL
ncbi:MAG: NAD(P)/FAD-dependent oxidoreductase [Leptolyngbyaceae cyanobacterium]